jgi:hypothetical protein
VFKSALAKAATIPLRNRIGIGVATVLTGGALVAVGVSGASAATAPSSPTVEASATSSAAPKGEAANRLSAFLRISATSNQAAGDRAEKAAAALVNHPKVFAKFPSNLQADITALKDATGADRITDAAKIKTTALSGGYGQTVQNQAKEAQNEAAHPLASGLREELRAVLQSTNPGSAAQKVAATLSNKPKLFAKLPGNLQTDLTALKNAAPADTDAQAAKIKSTALSGGYGAKIQKLVEGIQTKKDPATKPTSTASPATAS